MQNNKGGDEEKTEPKENDKWMDNNDKDSGIVTPKNTSNLDALRGRAKVFASNKYHLIILLLCIILFILFITVISLAVQLGTYKCAEPNECRTADCLKAASSILSRSDFSLQPCDDFWTYSCKNWISQNPIPPNRGSYSVADKLKREIYFRIRHLIDLVPHNLDLNSIQMKVKTFYDSCKSMQNIERQFPIDLSRAIAELGGWELSAEYPQSSVWDRQRVLSDLHSLYGISVFFKVVVEPDDLNPLRNIIKLKPGGLGLPNRDYYFRAHNDLYVKAYKNFMIETVKELGVGLERANRFADEVFNYEKRIAEITPSEEELRNTKNLYVTMTIKNLDRPPSVVLWTQFFQQYFPDAAFPETEIGVLSTNYINGISRIMASTPDGVLNNYFMWRFMQTMVPFSSPKFRLVENYFKQTFEGVSDLNLSYKENWEFCIDLTSKFIGHAIGSMYISHYYPQESQNQVQHYLHKLAASLSSMTNNLPWLKDQAEISSALSKVRSLFLLSGHPNFVKNNTMDAYYKNLRLKIPSDFLGNIRSGIYFIRKKQEEMLKTAAVSDYSWTLYSHDIGSEYKYAGNQLVVPAALFEYPLFDSKSPLAVKYGVLAAYVANKLAEAFDDKGINYDEYGTLKSWLSNETQMAFARKKECLKTALSISFLDDIQANPDLTIGSFIAEIGGVKLAYEAYKQHAREDEEWSALPNIGITNDQAFFISYAQSLCQATKPDKLRASRDSSTKLPEELRVLSTLKQLPEFAKAFSCSRDTAMNSQEKCRAW